MLFNCIASNPVDGKGFFSCAHHVFRIFFFSLFRCFLFSIPIVFTSILLGFLFHKVFHIIFFPLYAVWSNWMCVFFFSFLACTSLTFLLLLCRRFAVSSNLLASFLNTIRLAVFFRFGFYLLFLVLSQTQYTFCLSRCVILQEFCLRCRFHHCVVCSQSKLCATAFLYATQFGYMAKWNKSTK